MNVAALLPILLDGDGTASRLMERQVSGQPVVGHVLDRLTRIAQLDKILIVTTSRACDDPVEAFCEARGIEVYRGREEGANSLGLLLAAARSAGAQGGLLVRADSPLIDPAILQRVVDLLSMTDGMVDFVGTTLARTYPRGMDAEAFTLAALEDSDRRCADPELRRAATAHLRQNSRLYRLLSVQPEDGRARPDLAFDVGCDADLEAVARIFRHFGGRADLSLDELIGFADTKA